MISKTQKNKLISRFIFTIILISFLLVSFLLIFWSERLFGRYEYGIALTVFFWSIILGFALSYLPSKSIASIFGGLVGASLSEAGEGAGLIAVLQQEVTTLAISIGSITPKAQVPDPFIVGMIWLFVGIITLYCLLPTIFDKNFIDLV